MTAASLKREPGPSLGRVPLAARDQLWAAARRPGPVSHHSAPTTSTARTPLGERSAVDQRGVARPEVVAHDGVLPAGDAEAQGVALGLEEGGVLVVGRRGRGDGGDEGRRALVQGAARAAVGQALDAAVGRVGGLGRDAGERERGRVGPGAVVVAVVEEDGADRLDVVERGRRRGSAGEGAHRPAAAGDPGAGGVAAARRVEGGVARDDPAVVGGRRARAEVAAEPFESALDGVDVRVDEAGVQHPAREVVHDRAGAAPVGEVGRDRRDAPPDDGDLERPGGGAAGRGTGNSTAARPRVDDSAGEEEICVGHGPRVGGWERARAPGVQTVDYAEVLALTSYEVFVDSKKLTSWRVSFAVAIHFAGFDTLYSGSKPSSSRRRSARYLTYWLM